MSTRPGATPHEATCGESSRPHAQRSGAGAGGSGSPGDHGVSHAHATSSRSRLAVALGITATVLAVELVGAALTGSLALAADAGHMAVDSTGLVVALVATHLMARPRDDRHTWGWARSEVIAAALQAGMLAIICVTVAWEAVQRLSDPEPIEPGPMLVVGAVGLAANVASLLILAGGRRQSLTVRAAVLEVVTDALGSAAVIAAAVLALTVGWIGADAVASLVIAALMAPRAVLLLRRSLSILMEETPADLDLRLVREHMLAVPGVSDVHDLHVTTIGTGVVSLTAHVAVGADVPEDERRLVVHTLQTCVSTHFPVVVGHSTFQVDTPEHRDHEVLAH